jgi:hypothetical protein
MDKKRLIFYLALVLTIVASLVYGIVLGDPPEMRMEASGL